MAAHFQMCAFCFFPPLTLRESKKKPYTTRETPVGLSSNFIVLLEQIALTSQSSLSLWTGICGAGHEEFNSLFTDKSLKPFPTRQLQTLDFERKLEHVKIEIQVFKVEDTNLSHVMIFCVYTEQMDVKGKRTPCTYNEDETWSEDEDGRFREQLGFNTKTLDDFGSMNLSQYLTQRYIVQLQQKV